MRVYLPCIPTPRGRAPIVRQRENVAQKDTEDVDGMYTCGHMGRVGVRILDGSDTVIESKHNNVIHTIQPDCVQIRGTTIK